jgi:alpha-L-fucosidase
MDSTFGINLAAGATVSSPNGVHSRALLDGKNDTWWTTTGSDTTATITFALAGEKTFDVLSLQEEIRIGQRVEQFALEYDDHGQWKEIASGTTIGYKRLIHFPPVTTHSVRLRILSSRLNPTIAAFGLYKLVK